MPTIPAWVPPIPSRTTLNNQNNVNESLKTILAEGSPAPIILGRAQVGGKIFAVDYDSSSSPGVFTVGVLWAVGENNSIVNVYANGAAFSGLNQNDYPGRTTQTADSLLSAAITGYSDTLVLNKNGTNIPFCYSVLQWNDTHYSSFPDFVAEIEGLRTNGGAYSNSPARAVEYLIEHAALGPNATADSTSFSAVATDNAATVTTESRRTIGLVVDRTQRFDDWLKVAAVYMSAWITKKGDTYYAVSDRPASSVATLTTDDWEQGSFGLQVPDRDNQPTVVEITFTDTSSTIWRDRVARAEVSGVSTGTVKERISRVRMPGVTRYTQARREAIERLNKLYNGGMTISFDAFDDQIVREVGDVITVTRGSHLNAVQFRVSQPPVKRLGGGVRIVAMEYLSGAYSDVEPTDPTYNDDAQSLGDGTAGGDWGDIANMPVNLSTLTGTEDIDNSDVNISVSGTTIGLDGGGTTTYVLDQTNVGLSGVQNNADQTSSNTAAGIAGQGALATANEVSWTSEVTSRPTELTDGRVSTGLDSDGNLISSVNGTPASIVGQSTGGAWRNGFEDGSEFSGWTAPTGHTLTRETSEVFSGSSSARIVTATQSSSAAGTTGAVYFAIPEEIALSFGGRKILITCYAKAATSSGASSFQMAYSTNEVGNSGFSSFTPTTSWQPFAFTYDVPDPVNGGTDFIGIQGDGSSGVLYVDNVAIMALMNDDEINLSGVPNALQYSGGGTFTGDLASTRNTGALADADTVNLASTGSGGVTGLLPTGNAATGLRNSGISINADGSIVGAGGGQVTIGGLGYTGALNATRNTGALADQDTVNLATTGAGGVTGLLPTGRGGTGLTSITTLQNTNVTTYTVDKAATATWSALGSATQITGPPAPYNVTITWRDGSGTSLGTTVIRMSYTSSGTSISTTSHTTQSNSASATVSLNATNTAALKVTTVTLNSVVVTVTSSVVNGISWSFSK